LPAELRHVRWKFKSSAGNLKVQPEIRRSSGSFRFSAEYLNFQRKFPKFRCSLNFPPEHFVVRRKSGFSAELLDFQLNF